MPWAAVSDLIPMPIAALPCTVELGTHQNMGGCNANGSLASGDSCTIDCNSGYEASAPSNRVATCTTPNATIAMPDTVCSRMSHANSIR
jgi:hypothetical protein